MHRHLALGVGAQVGHLPALLAYVGQRAHYEVGQVERHRHVILGLVGGVTEHHALVAGPLLVFVAAAHAPVYVAALLVDGCHYAARVAVKLVFGLGVAYAVDGVARHSLQVYVLGAVHLAHYHHLTGGDKGLAGHVGLGVVSQELVEYGV